MSDEIKKAQQMAIDLEIDKVIENIVTKAGSMPEATLGQWEGCQLVVEHQLEKSCKNFSIVMPNGLILYKAQRDNRGALAVTDFRYGSWVEKIKAYSKQMNLSSFAEISDDEFDKVTSQYKDLPF